MSKPMSKPISMSNPKSMPEAMPRSLSLHRPLHHRESPSARCARAAGVVALGLALALAGAGATGCASTIVRIHTSTRLDARARWVILPVANYAEAAQAGERVEALLDTVLRIEGVRSLDRYPALKDDEAHLLVGERGRYEESLAWARANHYDYAVSGSVEEWRYKAGSDAEPAVGLTVTVTDLSSNETLWSGSGARVGRSVDNASGVALVLVSSLLDEVKWK